VRFLLQMSQRGSYESVTIEALVAHKENSMTLTRQRKGNGRWRTMLAVTSLTTLLMASVARADTSVTVVSGGISPDPATVGQSFSASFSASLNGTPGTGQECQASNVHWSWTATVSGPSGSQTFTGGDSDHFGFSYTPSAPGTYNVSATATASYDASAECGGNGSKSGSASDSTDAIGQTCPAA